MKIITIEGGCTKRNKLVGYQFNPINNKYYICGSYSVTPGSSHGSEEELDGEFLYGQYTRGCKLAAISSSISALTARHSTATTAKSKSV